jgi:hypothetical protein
MAAVQEAWQYLNKSKERLEAQVCLSRRSFKYYLINIRLSKVLHCRLRICHTTSHLPSPPSVSPICQCTFYYNSSTVPIESFQHK